MSEGAKGGRGEGDAENEGKEGGSGEESEG
mgnify:CR=1 FL=1